MSNTITNVVCCPLPPWSLGLALQSNRLCSSKYQGDDRDLSHITRKDSSAPPLFSAELYQPGSLYGFLKDSYRSLRNRRFPVLVSFSVYLNSYATVDCATCSFNYDNRRDGPTMYNQLF